jgi:hypothetical protein
VEYRGAKVYLEKCQTRKQQDTDWVLASNP